MFINYTKYEKKLFFNQIFSISNKALEKKFNPGIDTAKAEQRKKIKGNQCKFPRNSFEIVLDLSLPP